MRVLQIEDDPGTATAVELILKSEGYCIQTTNLGKEGVDLAVLYDYDIILLDINLPDMSGFEVLRTIRTKSVRTPVLIVSGMAGVQDKVLGLNLGSDDYLTKPFHRDELVARIYAIVRRAKGYSQSIVSIQNLTIDFSKRKVKVNDQIIYLTGKEYQLLEILILRIGTVISKHMMLNHLYGNYSWPNKRVIDVFICKIRKKLTQANCQVIIQNIWGRGYVIKA